MPSCLALVAVLRQCSLGNACLRRADKVITKNLEHASHQDREVCYRTATGARPAFQ